jgi:guanosine-3',5'-bis(diphosphate) 3'-pyrophosphohydrolase
MDDFGLVLKALAFAARKHRDQRRKDAEASPYINHPIALADVLVNVGNIRDVSVICAALLHDTVEDTECTEDELVHEFGEKIAGIVMEVTQDMARPKPERKQEEIAHARHLSPEARLVKLADKISNLGDLAVSRPLGWSLERTQAYFDHARLVIDGVRGISVELEAAFDAVLAQRPTA